VIGVSLQIVFAANCRRQCTAMLDAATGGQLFDHRADAKDACVSGSRQLRAVPQNTTTAASSFSFVIFMPAGILGWLERHVRPRATRQSAAHLMRGSESLAALPGLAGASSGRFELTARLAVPPRPTYRAA